MDCRGNLISDNIAGPRSNRRQLNDESSDNSTQELVTLESCEALILPGTKRYGPEKPEGMGTEEEEEETSEGTDFEDITSSKTEEEDEMFADGSEEKPEIKRSIDFLIDKLQSEDFEEEGKIEEEAEEEIEEEQELEEKAIEEEKLFQMEEFPEFEESRTALDSVTFFSSEEEEEDDDDDDEEETVEEEEEEIALINVLDREDTELLKFRDDYEVRDMVIMAIRDNIVNEVIKRAFARFKSTLVVPFTVLCMHKSWRRLIYLYCNEEYEKDFKENEWTPDVQPEPCNKDAWASNEIPVDDADSEISDVESVDMDVSSSDKQDHFVDTMDSILHKTNNWDKTVKFYGFGEEEEEDEEEVVDDGDSQERDEKPVKYKKQKRISDVGVDLEDLDNYWEVVDTRNIKETKDKLKEEDKKPADLLEPPARLLEKEIPQKEISSSRKSTGTKIIPSTAPSPSKTTRSSEKKFSWKYRPTEMELPKTEEYQPRFINPSSFPEPSIGIDYKVLPAEGGACKARRLRRTKIKVRDPKIAEELTAAEQFDRVFKKLSKSLERRPKKKQTKPKYATKPREG